MIINYNTEGRSQQPVVQQKEWLPGEGIPFLLNSEKPIVGIEIGVDEGVTSQYLLKSLPLLTLHGIDPYSDYVDWSKTLVTGQQNVYPAMLEKMKPFGERFIFHRKTSDDAVSLFEDESLDFIFIDGIHTYEQVLKDCENYWPKLKPKGLFCGHDFNGIQQVRDAVQEFANQIGKGISLTNQDVWFWFKR
jgi:predicted O-methyltransferase YrrM